MARPSQIAKILVRDLDKERHGVNHALLTTEPDKVLHNGCDLVVELVGGIEPARSFIDQSLASGKHVVTANKELLAAPAREQIGQAIAAASLHEADPGYKN